MDLTDEIEEFFPRIPTKLHDPEHTARRRSRACLLHPPHHHAIVACGFHYDGHPSRLENLKDGRAYLLCEPFLHLDSARKHFGNSGELRESNHSSVRDIADVHL